MIGDSDRNAREMETSKRAFGIREHMWNCFEDSLAFFQRGVLFYSFNDGEMLLPLRCEALGEGRDDILQSLFQVLAQSTLLVDSGQEIGLVSLQVSEEVRFPSEDLVHGDAVEETVNTSIDKGNHLVNGHRRILLLLEVLGQL